MAEVLNKYPSIFIHGLASWGAGDGLDSIFHYWGFNVTKDLMKYLRKNGYEVYNPSLGPLNGAWDRACELWAQLTGTRVDYGKVHSEKYGHARYGRTYDKPLVPNWGEEGDHRKINILGHSFGGPTVIAFAEILANGSAEEREGTPADELSDFFKGGHGYMLHTATTLAGVNNGTLMADAMGVKGMNAISVALLGAAAAIGEMASVTPMYDFMLDHWNITKRREELTEDNFVNPFTKKAEILKYYNNRLDHIGYEMQVQWQKEYNKTLTICPDIYYMARISCVSKENKKGKHTISVKDGGFMCAASSHLTGTYMNDYVRENYGVDGTWHPNDGFVNVRGQMGPDNLPNAQWPGAAEAKPGVWYNFVPEFRNHLSWNGASTKKKAFYKQYREMMDMFRSLPDGDKVESYKAD